MKKKIEKKKKHVHSSAYDLVIVTLVYPEKECFIPSKHVAHDTILCVWKPYNFMAYGWFILK